VRFKNKNVFFYFEKTLQLTTYNAGAVVVNTKCVGLALGLANTTSIDSKQHASIC
jgi:hypothetical protein